MTKLNIRMVPLKAVARAGYGINYVNYLSLSSFPIRRPLKGLRAILGGPTRFSEGALSNTVYKKHRFSEKSPPSVIYQEWEA